MGLAVHNMVTETAGEEEVSVLTATNRQIDPQVLDLQHLEQYTCGDKALEQELLGLFKEQAILQFENINDATNKSDWEMAVHTLKGCARGVGARNVAELCEVLEDVSFDGVEETKKSVTEQLKYAVAVSVVTVETVEKLTFT